MDFSSDDDLPLAKLKQNKNDSNVNNTDVESSTSNDDSYCDPDFFPQCEVDKCKKDLFSVCGKCSFAVCENHAKFKCDTGHELDFFDIEKSVTKEKPRSKKLKIDSENSVVEPLCETGTR